MQSAIKNTVFERRYYTLKGSKCIQKAKLHKVKYCQPESTQSQGSTTFQNQKSDHFDLKKIKCMEKTFTILTLRFLHMDFSYYNYS